MKQDQSTKGKPPSGRSTSRGKSARGNAAKVLEPVKFCKPSPEVLREYRASTALARLKEKSRAQKEAHAVGLTVY